VSQEGGLRERKKLATRAALSRAAIRMALERGMEQVTAEAVAEAAQVSTRTFHNYFANKEEAILEGAWSTIGILLDDLRDRPAEEPIWDSLEYLITRYMIGVAAKRPEHLTRARLMRTSPALMLPNRVLSERFIREFAEVVAERTGTDTTRDLYPNLVVAAAHAATSSAMRLWNNGESGLNPAELVAQAFKLLRQGLPEPPRSLQADPQ
jgi:AcrR family transcriptional regulator